MDCSICKQRFDPPVRIDLMRFGVGQDGRMASLDITVSVCEACGMTDQRIVRSSAKVIVTNNKWNWLDIVTESGEVQWTGGFHNYREALEEGLNSEAVA